MYLAPLHFRLTFLIGYELYAPELALCPYKSKLISLVSDLDFVCIVGDLKILCLLGVTVVHL